MKLKILTLFLFAALLMQGQEADEVHWESIKKGKKVELTVFYHPNKPFVYEDKGELVGIEIDILNYFVGWVKEKKGIDIKLVYQEPQAFGNLLIQTQQGRANTIGLGSVTISNERKENVQFSAPYLKNISILVTSGSVQTALTEEELKYTFNGLRPVSIKGTIHEKYIQDLSKRIAAAFQSVEYVGSPKALLKKVSESGKYYGYTDLITFWQFLKNNEVYIKMHKIANKNEEHFGFVFPRESDWVFVFNEFMESGFGFTSTKDYHKILEKHLGYEVIHSVEID